MDRTKKTRTVLRSGFTKALNSFDLVLNDVGSTLTDLSISFCALENKSAALDRCQEELVDKIDMATVSEDDLQKEFDEADEYKFKFMTAKVKYNERLASVNNVQQNSVQVPIAVNIDNQDAQVKIPQIEFQVFDGDVRNFLSFWNCFKKIDENQKINNADKFQLLIQAVKPGSDAHIFVKSYPQIPENYEKALKGLKERFGQDEILIEVYVRELLEIVLQKVANPTNTAALPVLYDKLVTHLRALESLGVTNDKCAAMLMPLVTSALPEDFLRAWQRSDKVHMQSADSDDTSVPKKDRLTRLIEFLGAEVNGEVRIALATQGFNFNNVFEGRKQRNDNYKKNNTPSAAGLLAAKARENLCIFCDSSEHFSANCEKAESMSLAERQNCAKNKRACFNCLIIGHGFRTCNVRVFCSKCKRKHVDLMCNVKAGENQRNDVEEKDDTASVRKEFACVANIRNCPQVFMQTLKVKVYNDNEEMIVRVLIDSGSQRSYIRKEVADKLRYKTIGEQRLAHMLFGGGQSESVIHKEYRVRMQSLLNDFACNFAALDQDNICGQIEAIPNNEWFNELRDYDIKLTDTWDSDEPISILIGADVAGKLLTGRRQELKSGLIAFETLLGWTIMGSVRNKSVCENSTVAAISLYVKNCDVKELWSLDTLGIKDPIEHKTKKEQEESMCAEFLEKVSVNDKGRYEVQLPFIENHAPLVDNKNIALKRLESTSNKLKREERYESYNAVFEEWLADGVIERVPEEEMDEWGHYLPHRHVIKENSTTVIRPVFDASAKLPPHPSLNECLHKGPNLIEQVTSTLLRFRVGEIGVISDIKKAFLMISVHPKHRNFLRFYWYDSNGKLIAFRHCRVVFGMCCSPFMLGAVITLHLENLCNLADNDFDSIFTRNNIEKLLSSFYVDNCVTSVNSMNELNDFMFEAKKAMELGGFDLRGWEFSGQNDSDSKTPVLGILWDKKYDVLSLNVANLNKSNVEEVTKRDMMSYAHRIFDPLGFVCPIIINVRILLQETWATNLKWDENVGADIKLRFLKWYNDLKNLSEIKIPRCFMGVINMGDEVSLHIFCDASKYAYATVIFIRIKNSHGVKVSFVQAKSRVAPTPSPTDAKISIPRLELLAANIGARLASTVKSTLNLNDVKTYFWSDSSTVVAWIKRENNWGAFVHNRVKEIRELSDPKCWRHVPGHLNPADLPSRGCTVTQLLASKWHDGPQWLFDAPENWPSSDPSVFNEDEINVELKKNAQFIEKTICFISIPAVNNTLLESFEKYSKYSKILRILAYIKRFLTSCRTKFEKRNKGELTFDEIKNAEINLLKLVQTASLSGFDRKIDEQFTLFKDNDGLIRLKSKIVLRDDTFNFKCPYVLSSKDNLIVKLLIREKHESLHHAGVQITMNALREKFWIIKPRQAIRTVIKECVTCRRHESKPCSAIPAPLPLNRVRDAAVFEVIGIDYAGPIFLKEGQKAWICIFTCAVFRAVHFELVCSLNVASLLMALQRFIARRGRPSIVYSDNGLNFKGLNNELKRIDYEKLAKTVALQEIDWRFNPPSAPWWGGFWERLIGILKKLLRRTLKKSSLNYVEMITVLADCEAIINSRPITFLSDTESEIMPLAPSNFLKDVEEIGVLDLDKIESCQIGKRYAYRQTLKTELRRRFRIEYLGMLIKHHGNAKNCTGVNVGDIVLIECDNAKRLDWPLAKVIDVIVGKDGVARVVKLRTAAGKLVRPIQRVFPLELNCDVTDVNLKCVNDNVSKTAKSSKNLTKQPIEIVENKIAHVTRFGRKVKNVDRLMYY